jgi:N6-adenosine-specific RNA methylase IME4
MTYRIIYTDPPWKYNSRANHKTRFRGGACGHYPLMTMAQIKALPIPDLADRNCALLMWCTFPYLDKQIELFKHWGFKYRTVAFTWVKTNPKNGKPFFGVGYYAKSNAEVCLLGIKGRVKPVSNSVSSIIIAPRREHSRKPEEARDRIVELFGDVPRLEMFARESAPGWDVWGNDVQSTVALPGIGKPERREVAPVLQPARPAPVEPVTLPLLDLLNAA